MFIDKLSEHSSYAGTTESDAEYQQLAVRLGALCRVYEQADRVLTGDPVKVNVIDEPGSPAAWSDGQNIYINRSQIEDFDIDELVQINGLNYHELAHILYSPRRGTSLLQWLIERNDVDGNYLTAFNILEDQRIETLLTGRYPSIAPYLTKTVARWLATTPDEAQANYLAVRGRRYLPLDVRIGFRDLFAFPDLIPVISEIVDEYRLLAFPTGYQRAQELTKRFKEEVLDVMGIQSPNHPPTSGGPNGCGDRVPPKQGRPEYGKSQQRDSDRAKGIGQAEPIYNRDKPKSNGGTDKAKQQSQDGDVSDGAGDDNNPSPDTDSKSPGTSSGGFTPESYSDINKRTPDATSDAPGTGHTISNGGLPDDLAKLLNDIDASVNQLQDVQAEIKTKQKIIIGGDGKHDEQIRAGKYTVLPTPQLAINAARKFGRELERLKQDLEPNWLREQATGKINVQRVIRGCSYDEAFDRWDEGAPGTDIEAVIAIDRSGSMSSRSNDMRASEAAWVIKRALEQIEAPVTVYSFDDRAELVFGRNSRADKLTMPFIYGNGGTNPHDAVVGAERLLKSSKHSTKLFFIITDGEFYNTATDDIIKRMNSSGVLTTMVLIADEDHVRRMQTEPNQDEAWHYCSIRGGMASASDLIPFAKQVVTGAIKKASGRF